MEAFAGESQARNKYTFYASKAKKEGYQLTHRISDIFSVLLHPPTARAGIEDNLDPGCVHVFELAKQYAWEIKQMAKAELAGHIAKGKY